MPYVNSKVTLKVSKDKEQILKQKLGKAMSLLNKPESYLMIGFEDECTLYFAGEELQKGAFIDIQIFGNATNQAYDKMTAEVCNIYEQELGIPQNKIYVKYQEVDHWGWNGSNF